MDYYSKGVPNQHRDIQQYVVQIEFSDHKTIMQLTLSYDHYLIQGQGYFAENEKASKVSYLCTTFQQTFICMYNVISYNFIQKERKRNKPQFSAQFTHVIRPLRHCPPTMAAQNKESQPLGKFPYSFFCVTPSACKKRGNAIYHVEMREAGDWMRLSTRSQSCVTSSRT